MVVQAALSLLMKCFMAVSIITDMYVYSILSLMYGLYMGVALPPSDTLTNQCSSSSRPYYCTEQRQPQVVILSSMASLALSLSHKSTYQILHQSARLLPVVVTFRDKRQFYGTDVLNHWPSLLQQPINISIY